MSQADPFRDGIAIRDLTFRYGQRVAVDRLSLTIPHSRIFALLGPNGSGKSTLFRVLATLIPMQEGEVSVLGLDLRRETRQIRLRQGVVFQAPSLDKKLTVIENLRQHGALYGLSGNPLKQKEEELLARFGLTDRARDRCEKLSGGQRRRVEIAKCLLHDPELLILDEPSTGLDPAARMELMRILTELRDEQRVTIVLTTHLLEEADRADEIAILDLGKVVAQGAPAALKSSVGGDSIELETRDANRLALQMREKLGLAPRIVDGAVRLETREATKQLARIMETFGEVVESAKIGKPSLEDVFIAKTGRRMLGDVFLEASLTHSKTGRH
jgi:ABC-2 type transport system ATP-binding protein